MLTNEQKPQDGPNSKFARAHFEMFVIANILVWMPFKAGGYAAPWICMAWFIFRASSGFTLIRLLVLLSFFFTALGGYILFYYMVDGDFVLQNAILFLFTYSSFLILPVLPTDVSTEKYFSKYMNVIGGILLFEASLGILQVMLFVILNRSTLDSATGDVAQGTLAPLSFIDPPSNFNNQIYTCNILILLLFYVPYALVYRRGFFTCAISFFVILIASVMHLLFAFVSAIGVITFFFTRTFLKFRPRRFAMAVIFILAGFFLVVTQPKNAALIKYYYSKAMESPKTVVTLNSYFKLPAEFPWVYFVGLGPGQYESRAALIGTGRYFGEPGNYQKIPGIKPNSSSAFKRYVERYWIEVSSNPERYGNSTMSRPFYSLLSLQIELGPIIFGLLLFGSFWVLLKLRIKHLTLIERGQRLDAFYASALAIMIVYFWGISAFENYLEVPHAILLAVILFKHFYAFIFTQTGVISVRENDHSLSAINR